MTKNSILSSAVSVVVGLFGFSLLIILFFVVSVLSANIAFFILRSIGA